jgi:hypothetical protein
MLFGRLLLVLHLGMAQRNTYKQRHLSYPHSTVAKNECLG